MKDKSRLPKNIITARPKGMSFEKYRELRKESNRKIRKYLLFGTLINQSWHFTGFDEQSGKFTGLVKSKHPLVRKELRKCQLRDLKRKEAKNV